jgi:hypothetical protein
MQPMPHADPSSSVLFRRARRAVGVLAALAAFSSSGLALADTGGPLPQGYTGDVNATPQPAPSTQPTNWADGPQDAQQAPQAQPQQPQVQQVQPPQVQQPQAQAPDAQADDGYADNDPSALTDFQQPLAGHGNWVQDPGYGTVWVPDSNEVGADFAPYQSAGQWTLDDGGEWMWQSDYAWGYIPFHYGRWVWTGGYWGWIPGRVYAPAWVTWRVGDGGYLGWAPLPPTWYWGPGGVAVGLWGTPWAAYCFVPTGYAFYRGVGGYVVRDPGVIRGAAASTRPYTPASPTVGHGGVAPGPHGHYYPASPSLSEARVPASAAAHAHATADARALSYASRSSTAAMQRASYGMGQGRGAGAWRGQYDSFGRSRSPAALRTPSGGESYARGGASYYRGGPSFHASAPSQYTRSYGGRSYAAPGGHYTAPVARPASRPAAHFSGGGHSGGGHHR